jgi:hypothetical protein
MVTWHAMEHVPSHRQRTARARVYRERQCRGTCSCLCHDHDHEAGQTRWHPYHPNGWVPSDRSDQLRSTSARAWEI